MQERTCYASLASNKTKKKNKDTFKIVDGQFIVFRELRL
jgi:hypothetical protein